MHVHAKVLLTLSLCLSAVAVCAQMASPQGAMINQGAVTHFVNGKWFDGTRFVATDFYAEGSTLTRHPDERRSYRTVDLHGGFVVPPYGDAHEHNFDGVAQTRAVAEQYLRDGIFYAAGMTDTTDGATAVMAAGLVDTPTTPDVTYAHGGLTGVNGHPKEVYESLANGFYYPQTDAQRKLVIEGNTREGKAFWQIADLAMLQAKWPAILASRPDQIKVFLTDSEHFKQATAADPRLGKGIDPALVEPIVRLAHAAGLRVFAHVDTVTDFHTALVGGVDAMAHLPGYGMSAKEDPAVYRIPDADIMLTAKRHVLVVATTSIALVDGTSPDEAARKALAQDNLSRMKAAGVEVLVGSDRYGSDAVKEADHLQSLGVWTNAEMLRMWSTETPEAIFPRRRIGELKVGDEASFLVLAANPLEEWAATHRIVDRWKQGQELAVPEKPVAVNSAK